MNNTTIQSGEPPSPTVETSGPGHPSPSILMRCLSVAASLRVTVVLFVLAMILVFFGTWAQKEASIQRVVQDFFRSEFIVWIPLKIVFMYSLDLEGSVPFPGGWLIGGLLLCNLLAAHAVRFKISWKRAGILLIHSGLVLMMLGEFIAGKYSYDGNMSIMEGTQCNHVDNMHQSELAVVDRSDAEKDHEFVIRGRQLATGKTIRHDQLPFDIDIVEYQTNSEFYDFDPKKDWINPANRGIGVRVVAEAKRETTATSSPSAYIRLKEKGTGRELGTYLVSSFFSDLQRPMEEVVVGGKKYSIALRYQRSYRDFSVQLVKFTHDKYPGTEIPKNFSSDIVLVDPPRGPREAKIYMNHPLRYNGETFYQVEVFPWAQGTVLQVGRNPGWTLPYLACIMVTLGMLVHFGIHLNGFLQQKRGPWTVNPTASRSTVHGPRSTVWTVVVLGAIYVAYCAWPPSPPSQGFRLDEFASFPVYFNGRPQPLDTVARNSLMIISGRQEFFDESGKRQPAIRWLLDVLNASDDLEAVQGPAGAYKVFRIENEEVLDIFGLQSRPGLRYSLNELRPMMKSFFSRINDLDHKETAKRDVFDAKVLELAQHLKLFRELASRSTILAKDERSLEILPIGTPSQQAATHEPIAAYAAMLSSFKLGDVDRFNKLAESYRERLEKESSAELGSARFEVFFNHFAPFYQAMMLYLVVFVLACLSWLFWPRSLGQAAFALGILALLVHTWAILARIYITGRPPVTNSYSSAVFIGWGCSVLGLFLEYVYRNGVGAVVGAVTGAVTLFIGHMLSGFGDTLEMVRAVLDTNFWLATHVVCITLGYTAMFVAGFFGIVYVLVTLLRPNVRRETVQELTRMIYGVVCFAMLFSFLGTILGGIWADQSWGRFWGWDAKENGALLIVLMNASILHARWGGMIKGRGLAVLAILGNIVTAWSWLGINMLGVGLHYYGHMSGGFKWLIVFVVSQLLLAILGMIDPAAIRSRLAPR